MTFEELRKIPDETEQVQKIYELFCEKPKFLGMSNHLLFVGEKT